MIDYKALFPVFVLDLSKQQDKVKHTMSEITIHARFQVSHSSAHTSFRGARVR